MEYIQLLIFVKQYLTSRCKNMHRVKKALRDNLNQEGFVKTQKELLKVPIFVRQSSLVIGIQKQQRHLWTMLRHPWNRAESML